VAAQYGHTSFIYHLITKWGAEVDAPDNDGRSPLHWYTFFFPWMVHLLINVQHFCLCRVFLFISLIPGSWESCSSVIRFVIIIIFPLFGVRKFLLRTAMHAKVFVNMLSRGKSPWQGCLQRVFGLHTVASLYGCLPGPCR